MPKFEGSKCRNCLQQQVDRLRPTLLLCEHGREMNRDYGEADRVIGLLILSPSLCK